MSWFLRAWTLNAYCLIVCPCFNIDSHVLASDRTLHWVSVKRHSGSLCLVPLCLHLTKNAEEHYVEIKQDKANEGFTSCVENFFWRMKVFAFAKCYADNAVLIMLLCFLCVSGFQPIHICKLQDLVASVKLDCSYMAPRYKVDLGEKKKKKKKETTLCAYT